MLRPHRRNRPPLPFSQRLVLHQWFLGLFGVQRFDQLALYLRDEALEGLDENNEERITLGEAPIVWKYFQYLALLSTGIYLGCYFRDPGALLSACWPAHSAVRPS